MHNNNSIEQNKSKFEYVNKLEWCPDIEGHFAYVLRLKSGRNYKGYTSHFKNRMLSHFNGYGGKTTKGDIPVFIFHFELLNTSKEAKDRENFFKSGHGYDFLRSATFPFNQIKP